MHVNEKGGRFGGTEEYIALLTAGLTARGVRSHLVCGVSTARRRRGSARCTSSTGWRRGPRSRHRRGAGRRGRRLDPDVIYLHNVFDPDAVAAVAALGGRGALIWYVHDHYVTCLSELRWRRDLGSCPQRLGHDCLTAIGDGQCVMRFPDRRRRRPTSTSG